MHTSCGSSHSYPGGISQLCLDKVGEAQPYKLCWSPWGYIWAEFALCIEASLGSCVVTARTGRNLCWSVILSLWNLSRMWWHSPQDTASCLVWLHAAASPSRLGIVSVLGKWWPIPAEPNSAFSCSDSGETKQSPGVVQAVRGAVEGFGASSTCSGCPRDSWCPLELSWAGSCPSVPAAGCSPPVPCSHPWIVWVGGSPWDIGDELHGAP